jgi:hypothetical protein
MAAASINDFHLHAHAKKNEVTRITQSPAVTMAKMIIPLNSRESDPESNELAS